MFIYLNIYIYNSVGKNTYCWQDHHVQKQIFMVERIKMFAHQLRYRKRLQRYQGHPSSLKDYIVCSFPSFNTEFWIVQVNTHKSLYPLNTWHDLYGFFGLLLR